MLPPRRQPSFLDFSDVKMVLKIYQKSDLKSSPRGVPPLWAQDLEGFDAAGKEKSSPGMLRSALSLLLGCSLVIPGGGCRVFFSLGADLLGGPKINPKINNFGWGPKMKPKWRHK